MTEKELSEIEARAKAASPGPWTARVMPNGVHTHGPDVVVEIGSFILFRATPSENWRGMGTLADAEMVAAARSDVPALIAEVRRLRARVECYNGCDDSDYALCPRTDYPGGTATIATSCRCGCHSPKHPEAGSNPHALDAASVESEPE